MSVFRLWFGLWCIICSCFSLPTYSWNALGHEIIAQIAHDYMRQSTQDSLINYDKLISKYYSSYNWIKTSVWLDTLHKHEVRELLPMHYIDLAYSKDNSPLTTIQPINAVWAIENAVQLVLSPQASAQDKAIALRILTHIVGDIHQPLHTISRISQQHPQGDYGGNLVKLPKNPIAKNLHAFWDRGGGLLQCKHKNQTKWIRDTAHSIEKTWPCTSQQLTFNPMQWAQESRVIALTKAYQANNKYNTRAYKIRTQNISAQQLAIAGCRLSAILDHLMQANLLQLKAYA